MSKTKPSGTRGAAAEEIPSVRRARSLSDLVEKDLLLSLTNDIASIRDKKDILKKIHPKLVQLFNTEDIFICTLDRGSETLRPFLRVAGAPRTDSLEYTNFMDTAFPIHDGFIDAILRAGKAIVFDLEEVSEWKTVPGYVNVSTRAGLKLSLSKVLYQGDNAVGVLTFWAENKNAFSDHHLALIDHVADQLSIAITNILAEEAIRQRERENEILLLISNEIAAIRNKDDLMRILSTSLINHLHYSDAAITVYNKERKVYNIYAYHLADSRRHHPQIQAALLADYPVGDSDLANSHLPVVLDVERVLQSGNQAVGFSAAAGIKEIASIKLVDGDNLIGVFALLSDRKNTFSSSSLYIMQRISYQISIAVAKLLTYEELQQREREKEVLLAISNELASSRKKADLLPVLKKHLEGLSFYNDITIAKVDSNQKTFSAFLINEESDRLEHPDYPRMKNAHHVFPDGVFERALHSRVPVLFDLEEIVKGPDAPVYVKFLHENGTVEMVGVSLRDRNKEIGALFCFSNKKTAFTQLQLNLVQGIGNQLGTVMANILANDDIKEREYEKSVLLALSNEIAAVRHKEDLFAVINSKFRELFSIRGFGISVLDNDGKTHQTFLASVEDYIQRHPEYSAVVSAAYAVNDGVFDTVLHAEDPVVISLREMDDRAASPGYIKFCKKLDIQTIVGVALRVGNKSLGVLFIHLEAEFIATIRGNLLKGVSAQIAIALSNILANERIAGQLNEIKGYQERLEKENLYLHEEITNGSTFSDIVGSSDPMRRLFNLLSQVAFTNSTVLLLGETGTGKELIARAIHNASARKEKLMVKVNCAAIPGNLIESELFGHEKGAFTGAHERRIGKFELAHNGTLFLDEIGELPLELQAKLLRVLQEKEIERIGGKNVIKVDVRIVAATNRNLQKEVQDGNFRSDLYYRLNVFPITIPPLRDRKEDIPVLASYFVKKYSKSTGKKIDSISSKAMKNLQAYHWPGNVRELEHLMERNVLLAPGTVIKDVHLPGVDNPPMNQHSGYIKTHEENERDHILYVLEQCKGKIFGRGGAAEMLGMKVSTLNSKIKKLGIKKENPFSEA